MGINRYPLWKNILIVFIICLGFIYALPNIFGEDPGVQVSAKSNGLPFAVKESILQTLKNNKVAYKKIYNDNKGSEWISLKDSHDQMQLRDELKEVLGNKYIVALNLIPAAPSWLQSLGGVPMKLGLDLRGGVHFLMQVDLKSVLNTRYNGMTKQIKNKLRGAHIRYRRISLDKQGGLSVLFKDQAQLQLGQDLLKKDYPQFVVTPKSNNALNLQFSVVEAKTINSDAMEQTMTTLRNRVNELGVAEALVQQQGANRVVVELPGIQDVAAAKDIIGKTATLEFLLVNNKIDATAPNAQIPPGNKIIKDAQGRPYVFKDDVILSGNQIVRAKSTIDQYGKPSVDITIGGDASNFTRISAQNIGKPMGTIYIETKFYNKKVNGKNKQFRKTTETAINVATIQSALPNRFQVTGLSSPKEAFQLALLLRSGALPAPMNIVEERTIGASLGADNITMGVNAIIGGLSLVLIFMVIYYGRFGLIADLALVFNLILLVAIMSLLGATLTLPGIAGMVLTLGMAVDANVLIFERIREEINKGNSPQSCIYSGFEKALTTIMDANVTTFIAALVLFTLGSGPIKGFAVTLTIGLVTSVFTAVMITRAIVNYCYGGRKINRIAIGI